MNMKPTTGTIRTTCAYCGVGCGVLATPEPDGSVSIAGDPEHPANFGRLCSKGSALGETIGLEDRLLSPRIEGRDASWDEALERVASGFAKVIAEDGPDAVAFYVSGQFLTEDYYVANKLMKGFIGSGNIGATNVLRTGGKTLAGPSAPIRCPEPIAIWKRPILSSWSAPISPGAIR